MLALATYARLPRLDRSDDLLLDALHASGIEARAVVWDDPRVDWSAFRAVVVRSCWDYHERPAAFASWIDALERLGIAVWNPPALLRWNMDKRYLRELAAGGARVVPTAWVARGDGVALADLAAAHGWDDVVIKPTVSASGARTWRATGAGIAARERDFAHLVAERDVMVQPFMRAIADEGEWSLVFLGGAFSHAVRKRPAAGEFRVQHEHGGAAHPAEAPRALVAAAEGVLAQVRAPWLYARVDGCAVAGELVLMELEMLEPSLFLDLAPGAPARLVRAITAALGSPPSAIGE